MRPIDADALIRRWCGIKCGCERDECGREIEPCIVVMTIEEAPTIDRPQGEWVYTDNPLRLNDEWECSRCGNISFMETNYCPNCGAKMKQ